MVSGLVIGYQHKGRRTVRTTQTVIVHGTVAATVSKGQYRYFANLLGNLQNLVSLQVFNDEFVRSNQILFPGHCVIHTGLLALTAGAESYVHANHAGRIDADRLNQSTADEPVGT